MLSRFSLTSSAEHWGSFSKPSPQQSTPHSLALPFLCQSTPSLLPSFPTEPPVPRSPNSGTLYKRLRHSLTSTTEPTKHSVNCYYLQLKKYMSVPSATFMPDMVKPPSFRSWTISMRPTQTSPQLTCKEMTPVCAPCTMQITYLKTYSIRSKMPSSTQQQGILPIPPRKCSILPYRSSFKQYSSLKTLRYGIRSLRLTRPGQTSRCNFQQPNSNGVAPRSLLPDLVSSPPTTPTSKTQLTLFPILP